MDADNLPSTLTLEYLDGADCKTIGSTGFLLTAPLQAAGPFQLLFYADVQKVLPETLKLTPIPGATESAAYVRDGKIQTEAYREILARVLISPATLRDLVNVGSTILQQYESAIAKLPEGSR